MPPPFRADHVGSLLRPPDLLRARERHAAGELSAEELRAVEDAAVRDAVAMQERVGLAAATDGEFRRTSWHMDFIYSLGGISRGEERLTIPFRNATSDIEFTTDSMRIDGPIRLREPIFTEAYDFLAETVTTALPKLTIPSPSMVHYRSGARAAVDPAVYPDYDQVWADLATAYQLQIQALYEHGCRYLQIDDTSLAYLNDPEQRKVIAERGFDPDHQHELNIRVFNAAIANKPADLTVTTHMCRGNYRSSWIAEGGYDFVAEALFGDLAVDGFFMEWDDERSGGFEPLRFVPPGRTVVLGLVTTKRGELESADAIARRIDEAARYVPLEQLCLSPQCGFSSTVEGNELTIEEEIAKLELVVEVAQRVWGDM